MLTHCKEITVYSTHLLCLLILSLLTPKLLKADLLFHPFEWVPLSNTQTAFLRLESYLFKSTKNYSSHFSTQTPLASHSFNPYQRIGFDVFAKITVIENFLVYTRLTFAQNKFSNPHFSRSGLADQSLGATLRWIERSPIEIDFQTQLDLPAYKNQMDPSLPQLESYLGNGSVDWTNGLFLSLFLHSNLKLITGLGLQLRTDRFSASIPWTLGVLHSPLNKGLEGELSFLGFQSLKTDSTELNTKTSSNFVIHAINPSRTLLKIKGGYRFNSGMSGSLDLQKSIFGKNSVDGWKITLGLSFDFLSQQTQTFQQNIQTKKQKNASLEAQVIGINDKAHFVKINKGLEDNLNLGQIFDIFEVQINGSLGSHIARCKLTHLRAHEAVLQILEYLEPKWIENHFIARLNVE